MLCLPIPQPGLRGLRSILVPSGGVAQMVRATDS
jgi:hypothetical protein